MKIEEFLKIRYSENYRELTNKPLSEIFKFDFAVFLKKCIQKMNVRLNFSTRTMSGL